MRGARQPRRGWWRGAAPRSPRGSRRARSHPYVHRSHRVGPDGGSDAPSLNGTGKGAFPFSRVPSWLKRHPSSAFDEAAGIKVCGATRTAGRGRPPNDASPSGVDLSSLAPRQRARPPTPQPRPPWQDGSKGLQSVVVGSGYADGLVRVPSNESKRSASMSRGTAGPSEEIQAACRWAPRQTGQGPGRSPGAGEGCAGRRGRGAFGNAVPAAAAPAAAATARLAYGPAARARRCVPLALAVTCPSAPAFPFPHSRRNLVTGRPTGEEEEMQLHSVLGEGSYGKVYKGSWRGTTVAIKVMILPAAMSGKERREKMAVMETAISSSLSHPNIVQVRVGQGPRGARRRHRAGAPPRRGNEACGMHPCARAARAHGARGAFAYGCCQRPAPASAPDLHLQHPSGQVGVPPRRAAAAQPRRQRARQLRERAELAAERQRRAGAAAAAAGAWKGLGCALVGVAAGAGVLRPRQPARRAVHGPLPQAGRLRRRQPAWQRLGLRLRTGGGAGGGERRRRRRRRRRGRKGRGRAAGGRGPRKSAGHRAGRRAGNGAPARPGGAGGRAGQGGVATSQGSAGNGPGWPRVCSWRPPTETPSTTRPDRPARLAPSHLPGPPTPAWPTPRPAPPYLSPWPPPPNPSSLLPTRRATNIHPTLRPRPCPLPCSPSSTLT
jgi:hypothetical protein